MPSIFIAGICGGSFVWSILMLIMIREESCLKIFKFSFSIFLLTSFWLFIGVTLQEKKEIMLKVSASVIDGKPIVYVGEHAIPCKKCLVGQTVDVVYYPSEFSFGLSLPSYPYIKNENNESNREHTN